MSQPDFDHSHWRPEPARCNFWVQPLNTGGCDPKLIKLKKTNSFLDIQGSIGKNRIGICHRFIFYGHLLWNSSTSVFPVSLNLDVLTLCPYCPGQLQPLAQDLGGKVGEGHCIKQTPAFALTQTAYDPKAWTVFYVCWLLLCYFVSFSATNTPHGSPLC